MLDVLAIIAGFVLMTGGSYLLVGSASNLARSLGVTELVIGATIVAFGTSLPELITVIVASARGSSGIGFGNIVGSNTINVLGILGAAVVIMPISLKSADGSGPDAVTIIAFIVASLYLLWCLLYRQRLTRLDGLVLVTLFVAYAWFSYTVKPAKAAGPEPPSLSMTGKDESSGPDADRS
jgi:cation:H+ antiporter